MSALSIKNLCKVYKGGVQALKGIDLCVNEGDFFALLGPNGAGKTTVIGIISSLVTKTSGEVKVFGNNIDTNWEEAKVELGVVPQEFNFNVFESVEEIVINQAGYFGVNRKLAKERAEFYLKEVDLWQKRKVAARNLSGGMKRRLMIARALAHNPKLLVLDEPTAGVDIEIRRSMWNFLRKLNQNGTTIILTTHYLEEAENLCNKIAIINHGVLIDNTTMSAIMANLKEQSFILELKNPLSNIPKLNFGTLLKIDDLKLELILPAKVTINDVFTELTDNGIIINGLKNKTNRLEELFVSLTGKVG